MAKGHDGDGLLKSIIEAGKENVDFLAFALLAALALGSVARGAEFWKIAGLCVILAALWVAMRYALVALQSRERLNKLRETAETEAQKKLAKYATKDEIADLFSDQQRSGGDNEH